MDSVSPIPVAAGQAQLGTWGTLDLKGPRTAVLQLAWAEDVELPESVAADLTSAVLLLNDQLGRLLLLPYAACYVAAYDLREGECLYPLLEIPRDPDRGMRMATVHIAQGLGALHLTEATMAFFLEDCTLGWMEAGDFGGWNIEAVRLDEVDLLFGDWLGSEKRQTWQLSTGQRLH